MQLTIQKLKKIDSPTMKGFVDIDINIDGAVLSIKGIRIVTKRDGGGYFYALPNRESVEPDGTKTYYPICAFFAKGDYGIFHDAMDAALKEYAKNPTQPPMPPLPTAQADYNDYNKTKTTDLSF